MKKIFSFISIILVLGTALEVSAVANTIQSADFLITTAALEANLNNPYVRIIDVRPYEQYIAGHISNAVYLSRGVVYVENKVGMHIPSKEQITTTMSNLGIDEATSVVIYDDSYGHWYPTSDTSQLFYKTQLY